MLRTMMKSKIHRATVTQADLHYVALHANGREADLCITQLLARVVSYGRQPVGSQFVGIHGVQHVRATTQIEP